VNYTQPELACNYYCVFNGLNVEKNSDSRKSSADRFVFVRGYRYRDGGSGLKVG